MPVQESDSGAERSGLTRRHFLAASGAGLAGVGLAAGSGGEASPADRAPEPLPEDGKTMKHEAKITLVQLTFHDDSDSVLARMPAFFEQASAYGADLIVFPEYVLGSHIGVEHERVQRFMELAREHNMYAIAGLVESCGERWSTTALMVDRSGNLLGRYLKCHPASGPAPYWWPPMKGNDAEARGVLGAQFKVFHLDFAPVGILQCYDGYFPEAWGCTSYSGAEIILWINGRDGMVEDSYCLFASQAYGCIVGANITNGRNTGFAGCGCIAPNPGEEPEEMRLYPRIKTPGDQCVSATINLDELRRRRKHLRTMHQRRPELYGLLTQNVTMWQDYPDVPWEYPECADLVNRAQL